MQIFLFGPLREALGAPAVEVASRSDLDSLREQLVLQYPVLQNHSWRIAVNRKLPTENISLVENDVVALLPPFSGG